jgi:hypothetical protein
MTGKRNDEQELGIMLIDFNPVVREGLQAILAKDEHLVVTGDVPVTGLRCPAHQTVA